jgi:hypothetical protein
MCPEEAPIAVQNYEDLGHAWQLPHADVPGLPCDWQLHCSSAVGLG